MSKPFAYVTYIEHDNAKHLVSIHSTVEEAEGALFAYAQAVFGEDDTKTANARIVETLAEYGEHVRLYTMMTDRRGVQYSLEVLPFREALATAE